jgi:hypothetical protein
MWEDTSQPGDIILRAIPGGFLLGRALEQVGPGPWWQFIATLKDFPTAVRLARELASDAKVRAWIQTPQATYTEISLTAPDEPKPR